VSILTKHVAEVLGSATQKSLLQTLSGVFYFSISFWHFSLPFLKTLIQNIAYNIKKKHFFLSFIF
jgi:hypothetical protein